MKRNTPSIMCRILVLLFLFPAVSIHAQQYIIKTNVFSPVIQTGSFFCEHAVSDVLSLQMGVLGTWHYVDVERDITARGLAFTPELRYYPAENAPEGFYLAAFGRGYFYNQKKNTEVFSSEENAMITPGANINGVSLGMLVGGQFFFGKWVVADLFIGPSYSQFRLTKVKGDPEALYQPNDGISVRTGVAIGIRL